MRKCGWDSDPCSRGAFELEFKFRGGREQGTTIERGGDTYSPLLCQVRRFVGYILLCPAVDRISSAAWYISCGLVLHTILPRARCRAICGRSKHPLHSHQFMLPRMLINSCSARLLPHGMRLQSR
jgi:hypothetical protein